MTERRLIPSNRMAMPAGLKSPDSVSLTAREVMGIIRRHLFLIFIMTIFGFIAGFGVWKVLQKYYPEYTAKTYLKVLSPIPSDPWVIGGSPQQKDILYSHRRSIASLITQQSSLESLLDDNKIRQTEWFFENEGNEGNTLKLVKSLKKSFNAFPQRDSDFVEISMTCGKPGEAALIVNTMVDLFFAKQKAVEKEEVTQKLTQLNDQRSDIQKELDKASQGLNDIRDKYGIFDLELSDTRNFRHTITEILP